MAGEASGELSCELCGNFCHDSADNNFKIDIRDEFLSKATVPCNARVYVNGVTRDYMRFDAHGRKYSVEIGKGAHRTRIKGSGWKKFTSDFSLRKGVVVIFDLDMRPRQAYVVVQPVEGSISDGDADEEMIDGDISDVDEDGGSIKMSIQGV
ncbi:hypothetical protein ACQJBY_065821 [Aegilops geniculata]